jgi:DNA-binding transcriptional MerR regulator
MNSESREDKPLLIGSLSKEYGISSRALHFYESKGLLNPTRNGSLRIYTEEDRRRLAAILKAQKMGFSLREIATLLSRNQDDRPDMASLLNREEIVSQIDFLGRRLKEIDVALAELSKKVAETDATADV